MIDEQAFSAQQIVVVLNPHWLQTLICLESSTLVWTVAIDKRSYQACALLIRESSQNTSLCRSCWVLLPRGLLRRLAVLLWFKVPSANVHAVMMDRTVLLFSYSKTSIRTLQTSRGNLQHPFLGAGVSSILV